MKRHIVRFRDIENLACLMRYVPSITALRTLRDLTLRYSLSVAAGDLQFLDGRWYVTHSGLLQLAFRKGCCGIKPVLQERLSDVGSCRWVFKATVYKSRGSRGFVGDGDANHTDTYTLILSGELPLVQASET